MSPVQQGQCQREPRVPSRPSATFPQRNSDRREIFCVREKGLVTKPALQFRFSSAPQLAHIPLKPFSHGRLLGRVWMGHLGSQMHKLSRTAGLHHGKRLNEVDIIVSTLPANSPSRLACFAGDGRSPAPQTDLAKGGGLMKYPRLLSPSSGPIFRSPKLRRRQYPNAPWLRASSVSCLSTRLTRSLSNLAGPSDQWERSIEETPTAGPPLAHSVGATAMTPATRRGDR